MNTWSITLITITLMTVTPGFEIGMMIFMLFLLPFAPYPYLLPSDFSIHPIKKWNLFSYMTHFVQ